MRSSAVIVSESLATNILPIKKFGKKSLIDHGLSETITADDLKEYFEKFGPVTDVYIPKQFRSFAFVTFQESNRDWAILDS